MSDARTIHCEEALRLLATYLDGELGGGWQESVARHLETCHGCYSRAEFERRLKAAFEQLHQEPVTPGFEQRVRGLLAQFAPSPAGPPPAD